jgi:hypothetical protein
MGDEIAAILGGLRQLPGIGVVAVVAGVATQDRPHLALKLLLSRVLPDGK